MSAETSAAVDFTNSRTSGRAMADVRNIFPVMLIKFPDTGRKIPCYFLAAFRAEIENASHFRAMQPTSAVDGGLKDEKFPVFSLLNREYHPDAGCGRLQTPPLLPPAAAVFPEVETFAAVAGVFRYRRVVENGFGALTGTFSPVFSARDCVRPVGLS